MRFYILGSYVNANCLYLTHLPNPGESLLADSLRVEHGGKGLNVAIAVHRLEGQVDTVLSVGFDAAADSVLQLLQDNGMATHGIFRVNAPSGFGVGFIDQHGNNFLAVYPGANALLSAAHIRQTQTFLCAAKMVYAQFEIPETAILTAFKQARQQGIRTFLNPSPWRSVNATLIQLTDILVLNEHEAAALFELPENGRLSPIEWQQALPQFAAQCQWQGRLLVVTLAEQGCVAWAMDSVIDVPAFNIALVDATGAGDAFNAGLMVALAAQKPLRQALTMACACGAWVASRAGVLQALPTLADITEWLATPDSLI